MRSMVGALIFVLTMFLSGISSTVQGLHEAGPRGLAQNQRPWGLSSPHKNNAGTAGSDNYPVRLRGGQTEPEEGEEDEEEDEEGEDEEEDDDEYDEEEEDEYYEEEEEL